MTNEHLTAIKSLQIAREAESNAHLLAMEIQSLDYVINNTKAEQDFLQKYTKDFQGFFGLHQIIYELEKQKRERTKSLNNHKIMVKEIINLN